MKLALLALAGELLRSNIHKSKKKKEVRGPINLNEKGDFQFGLCTFDDEDLLATPVDFKPRQQNQPSETN